MKAIAFTDADPTLSLTELPQPEPVPTEVLVRVRAAGVNPVDWKTQQGSGMRGFFDGSAPMVLGWDVAGEIAAVGPGVTRFRVGDRVFGMPRFPHPAACFAEFITCPARHLARIPEGVSDEVAGAAPLAAITAWQALVDTLDVQPGQRVLIHAAAGGVGHIAVQIAKARGAEVWGTVSEPKHAQMRELGLDHPIDYKTQDFTKVATQMDAVIDFVGGAEHSLRSLESLRRGGRLVCIPSPSDLPSSEALAERGVTADWLLVEPDYAALEAIGKLLAAGTLKILIAQTKPLEELAALMELSVSGKVTGKLVATVS